MLTKNPVDDSTRGVWIAPETIDGKGFPDNFARAA